MFLREDLDERDEPQPVGEVAAKIVESHVGDFEMLVAPSCEGVLVYTIWCQTTACPSNPCTLTAGPTGNFTSLCFGILHPLVFVIC